VYGLALEDISQCASRAKGDGDGVQDVDGEAGERIDGEVLVEQEEGVFDRPVTGEVEDRRGHDELGWFQERWV
jgi:hypothetical protein